MKNKRKDSVAYFATREDARVICGYGKSYESSLRKVGRLIDEEIKKDSDVLVLGMNVSYDEDSVFCVTVTISSVTL